MKPTFAGTLVRADTNSLLAASIDPVEFLRTIKQCSLRVGPCFVCITHADEDPNSFMLFPLLPAAGGSVAIREKRQ